MPPVNKKEPGLASAASLFSSYRWKARNRGLDFQLTFDEFLQLTGSNCYLCGTPPGQIVRGRHRNGDYVYNGIDRVDNSRGYLVDNSMACCKTCNQIKLKLSIEELKSHIRKILKQLK